MKFKLRVKNMRNEIQAESKEYEEARTAQTGKNK